MVGLPSKFWRDLKRFANDRECILVRLQVPVCIIGLGIIDNGIDEALAGFAHHVTLTIEKDNSITITDDGRGVPVEIQPKTGRPAMEAVFTILHAGGKFDSKSYKVSGGLHGVGASVVNALSKEMDVRVYRDNKIYYMDFERGHIKTEMKLLDEPMRLKRGTIVHFAPDPDIFRETIVFDYRTLASRIRELAFLNKGLRLSTTDKRVDPVKMNHLCMRVELPSTSNF